MALEWHLFLQKSRMEDSTHVISWYFSTFGDTSSAALTPPDRPQLLPWTGVSVNKSLFSVLVVLVAQLCLTLCDTMDCSPPGFLRPWDSPGKNTGAGCHALLQGIFPNQGLLPCKEHHTAVLCTAFMGLSHLLLETSGHPSFSRKVSRPPHPLPAKLPQTEIILIAKWITVNTHFART